MSARLNRRITQAIVRLGFVQLQDKDRLDKHSNMPHPFRSKVRLIPKERAFYEFLWAHYLKNREWPTTWCVYREHLEKPKLVEALRHARYTLYSENSSVHPRTFELQIPGILLTAKGDVYLGWLASLFEYLRDRFYAGEGSQTVLTQADVAAALNLTKEQADELGQVMRGGFFGIYPVWQPNSPGWQVLLPCQLVEDFPRHGSLRRELGTMLERQLAQLKRSRRNQVPALALHDFAEARQTDRGDRSRRYQVFVSSTFIDLQEERQQVVQSLLEMQCFPAGMETFPATSDEQWKLIKSIINESDYYVVIVAARYGTLVPRKKISYTEREFEHARRMGIPILAFYHANPGKIDNEMAEDSRVGKARLRRFVEKLKTNRMCKAWSNAHELGSAVKSALQQAFKDDRRAGWVRGN